MKNEIITVTPEMAAAWLAQNRVNRRWRPSYIEFLCSEMKQGRFLFTGDPIRFDTGGMLIDGQHRLKAIVQANTPITLMVITGLAPQAFHKIDTGMTRTLADTTGIPAKLVHIYSVLLDITKGATLRKSSNDIIMLHDRLGIIGVALLQHVGANRKFYGSAPMRAAAVMSISTGQSKDYVLPLYKNLVTHQYSSLPPVAEVLTRQYEDSPIRLIENRTGESSSRVVAFLLGMYIYDEGNRSRKKLLIEHKRDHYLEACRHVVQEALSPDVPRIGLESTDHKYQRQLKENIKLREALVHKRMVEDAGD